MYSFKLFYFHLASPYDKALLGLGAAAEVELVLGSLVHCTIASR